MATISFDSFITKWTGKGIDTDGAYGGQCMDEMHKYIQEVLGLQDLSILASPTAAQVYSNFANVKGHELFTKIDNTPTGVPLKGDIVFWGASLSPSGAGHVAVFIQGDVNSFRSFDQNFPVGSLPHVQNHPNYNSVVGWLRLKIQEPMATITQKELDKIIADRDKHWNSLVASEEQVKALQDRITKIKEIAKTIVNS